MFIILVIISILLVLVFIRRKLARESNAHPLPPCYPGAWPVIGHTHKLLCNDRDLLKFIHVLAYDSIRQGGVTQTTFGGDIYYMVTDPEDALTVSNACIDKHYIYNGLEVWMGKGLVTRSAETYKTHRKIMNPAFTLPVVHNFLGLFNDQAKKFVSHLDPHIDNGPLDITDILGKILLETSCCEFRVTLLRKRNGAIPTVSTYGQMYEGDKLQTYLNYINKLENMTVQRFKKVWLQTDLTYKLLGYKQEEQRYVKYIHNVTEQAIKKFKEIRNNPTTLLSQFRSFIEVYQDLPGISSLSDEELRNEVDTAVGASFDTTWSSLTLVLLCVGTFGDVQEKIYKEILDVFGPEGDVEKEDLSKLVYTDAVIKECLRWMPAVPLIIRQVDKEVKLKNYTLRADTHCIIMICGINRQGWDEPEKFKPERWLEPGACCNFASFSLGKRNCIGRTYAMTSMKVFIVHLLRAYKLQANVHNVINRIEVTIKPYSGHEMILQRRSRYIPKDFVN